MLAIVIPYYKRNYFDKTLESLSRQTNQNFHVYIGDDASPEPPNELLATVKDALKVHYTRFESNMGQTSLVKHWERCLGLVNHESWIMLLGDDDVLETNCVAEFYKHLKDIEQRNIHVVRFASQVIDAQGKTMSNIVTHPVLETATYFYYRKLKKYTRSSLSEHIFRKEAYVTHRFKEFPLAWHTDDLAWLEFSEFKDVYSINDAVVSIRYTGDSISGKQDNLIEKQEARYQFFKILVFKHLGRFTIKQRLAILDEHETLLPKHVKCLTAKVFIVWQRFKISCIVLAKHIKNKWFST